MDNAFEKHNKNAELIEAFELLSKHAKADDLEGLMPFNEEEELNVNIDWERLIKISKKKSLFERIWNVTLGFGNLQLAIYGALSVVLTPLILILTYSWASKILPTLDLLQNIKTIAVLVFILSMTVLNLGTIIYIIFERFPNSTRKIRIPALEKRHTLSAVLMGICMVALIVGFYDFAGRSDSQIDPGYVRVALHDGASDKVIDYDYKMIFSNETAANQLTYKYTLILDSLKTNKSTLSYLSQNPEFFNAVAVLLEKQGQLMEAQEAYYLAEKSDPFVATTSYKYNNYPKMSHYKQWVKDINQGTYTYVNIEGKGKRVVSSADSIFFSNEIKAAEFLNTNANCSVTDDSLSCNNTKAVLLEYLSKDQEAKEVYSKLLKVERYDPTVLYNLKESLSLITGK